MIEIEQVHGLKVQAEALQIFAENAASELLCEMPPGEPQGDVALLDNAETLFLQAAEHLRDAAADLAEYIQINSQ